MSQDEIKTLAGNVALELGCNVDEKTGSVSYTHLDVYKRQEQEKMVEVQKLREKFEAAMEDDFNTADAVSAIFELVKLANSTACLLYTSSWTV